MLSSRGPPDPAAELCGGHRPASYPVRVHCEAIDCGAALEVRSPIVLQLQLRSASRGMLGEVLQQTLGGGSSSQPCNVKSFRSHPTVCLFLCAGRHAIQSGAGPASHRALWQLRQVRTPDGASNGAAKDDNAHVAACSSICIDDLPEQSVKHARPTCLHSVLTLHSCKAKGRQASLSSAVCAPCCQLL